MKYQLYLFVFSLFFTAICAQYQVQIKNQVNPCAGLSYATITLYERGEQKVLSEGQSVTVSASEFSQETGLGIQENGEYCRAGGGVAGCLNPDNAGMELVMNGGSCGNYTLNDPFYCGYNPPNAKDIVNVQMSGNWPNCVATLTRKGNAPGCANSC
eukprot:Phypoly_transcript_08164.p1 GENE.Phypoly_transcript_08164~~Phypoly_transcript_08164.p1  ORF type:complete len:156 (+),score=15.82 Phypoly_transcript_08164:924-1391(+)